MNKIFAPVFAVSMIFSGAVSASDRITDSEYLVLSRCAGLAQALDQDSEAWTQRLRDARSGRSPQMRDRAEVERNQAQRSARRADESRKAEFVQEIQVRCAAFTPTT